MQARIDILVTAVVPLLKKITIFEVKEANASLYQETEWPPGHPVFFRTYPKQVRSFLFGSSQGIFPSPLLRIHKH